jgi:hypothetical protein
MFHSSPLLVSFSVCARAARVYQERSACGGGQQRRAYRIEAVGAAAAAGRPASTAFSARAVPPEHRRSWESPLCSLRRAGESGGSILVGRHQWNTRFLTPPGRCDGHGRQLVFGGTVWVALPWMHAPQRLVFRGQRAGRVAHQLSGQWQTVCRWRGDVILTFGLVRGLYDIFAPCEPQSPGGDCEVFLRTVSSRGTAVPAAARNGSTLQN